MPEASDPEWVETEELSTLKAQAIARTYVDVDAVYRDAIGYRATVYAIAEADARAYKAGGYTGEVSEYVAGYARKNYTLAAQSNQWAADQIILRADAFRVAELAMRNTMFACQVDMRAASSPEALVVAIATWNGFIAALRAQLGL